MKFINLLLSCSLCFLINSYAQVDSIKKQDTIQQIKTVPQEKSEEKKEKKKESKPKNVNHQGGLVPSSNITETQDDSITISKDELKSLKAENSKLKNKNDKLENQVEDLKNQIQNLTPNENDKYEDEPKNIFSFFKFILKLFFWFVIIIAIVIFILMRNNKKIYRAIQKKIKPPPPIIITPAPQVKQQQPLITPKPVTAPIIKTVISTEPKSFSNISNNFQKLASRKNNWFVVAASSIGKSHLTSNKPCQDNHYCDYFGEGWGIAISCDGAGSADNSHFGSEHVAKESALKIFKEWIINSGYIKKNILPSESDWAIASKAAFTQIHNDLEKFAISKQLQPASVACTAIIVIFSPIGLLVTHIGDGRAGFCDQKGEWKSILTPHKGEESNQTIFITSKSWLNDSSLMMSDVSIPESRIIKERPVAFALLSDGCEMHSFDCSKMDDITSKWSDPNIPHPNFFNPLMNQLKLMNQNKNSLNDSLDKWRKFLEEGNQGLKDESDDKTLILGILV